MTTLHVKRGLEFRADLYSSRDRTKWLEAAGKELAARGASVKIGEGAGAVELKNEADLLAFYGRYEADPSGTAQAVGLPAGRELHAYIADLVQALDDVVKPSSSVTAGDVVDLSTTGDLAKVLGLDQKGVRYASGSSEFGKSAPPEGAMSVLGVQLSRHAQPIDPLAGAPFIDASTFASGTGMTGRDSLEFEAVRKLEGLDAKALVELMRSERGGRPVLNRMRKADYAEAFSVGYSGISLDEMRWDGDAHRVRQKNPYVSLTVESGRMEKDEEDSEWEVSQGTDFFWDRYYVAKDPTRPGKDALLDNDMMVRARVRYDEGGVVRRVLIQAKTGTDVDDNGVKSAGKADIRRDNPAAEDVAGLDQAVRSGKAKWSWAGREEPIDALSGVYQDLKAKGELPDVGPHEDVLLLDVGAHVFSVRSRYHLDETRPDAQLSMFKACHEKIGEALELAKAAGSSLPDADRKQIVDLAQGLMDRSLLVERAKERLLALDPQMTVDAATVAALMPSTSRSASKLESQKRRVVANVLQQSYGELAELIDEKRRDIAGDRDDDARAFDFESEAMDYLRATDPSLKYTRTVGPFLKKLDETLAGPGKDDFTKKLGEWLKTEENDDRLLSAPDKDVAMAGLRKNLVREHVEILHRQIEHAGTMAQSLWFDDVRRVYANTNPTTWNFLIDTFDFVSDIKPKDWDTLTPEQKDGRAPIPADKIYHADVVSEVQIELGYEKPYVDAIAAAKKALTEARAGLFMDLALAAPDSGAVSDKPESFVAFRDKLASLPDDERGAALAKLNELAKSKGSPLSFDDESLKPLAPEMFTVARQGQPTSGHAQLLDDLETNTWIWETLVDAQESIAEMRGERVVREVERAGHTARWVSSDMSKGETALRNIA